MSERGKNRSIFRRVLFALIKLAIIGMILVIGINFYVIKATEGQIGAVFDSPEDSATEEEVSELSAIEPECIMVLGASVTADGRPSSILRDRLDTAIKALDIRLEHYEWYEIYKASGQQAIR